MNMLGFTPLIDPLVALYPAMSDYWLWMVVPLVLSISLVYKGTRVKELRELPRGVMVMTLQVLFFMTIAAAGIGGLYWVAVRVL